MRTGLFVIAALVPIMGLAQAEEGVRPFVYYAAYFECDAGGPALADGIVNAAIAGICNDAVDAG